MKAIVTGGTGFVGSHLCEMLQKQGIETVALSRKKTDSSYLGKLGIPVVYGDISNPESLKGIISKGDIVFHSAAILGAVKAPWSEYEKINVQGTENILNAAIEKQAKCFVFLSSMTAMGPVGSPEKPMTEETPPAPDSLYGKSKLAAENRIKEIGGGKITCIILSLPIIFGPRANPKSSAMMLFSGMRKKTFAIIGDTENYFPISYVKNLAAAMIHLSGVHSEGIHTYIIADGEPVKFRTILGMIHENFGTNKRIIHIPYGPVFVIALLFELAGKMFSFIPLLSTDVVRGMAKSVFCYDMTKALQAGYTPVSDTREGIRETAEWMKGETSHPG